MPLSGSVLSVILASFTVLVISLLYLSQKALFLDSSSDPSSNAPRIRKRDKLSTFLHNVNDGLKRRIKHHHSGVVLVSSARERTALRIGRTSMIPSTREDHKEQEQEQEHEDDEDLHPGLKKKLESMSWFRRLLGHTPDVRHLHEANNFHLEDEMENEAALKAAIRLASIVRSWIRADAIQSSTVHDMARTLIFNDTILEKQFSFYYL